MRKIKNISKFKKGFTLIELLLVMVIIGIMATAGVVNYIAVRERARDAERKADLVQLRSAVELYKADQGSYPTSLSTCGSSLQNSGIVYMQSVPCDPSTLSDYDYIPGGTPPSSYYLVACLENTNDAQKDVPINPYGTSCSVASYSVTNP